MAATYEDLLELAGAFGRYQLILLCWIASTLVVVVQNQFFMMFGGIFPKCNGTAAECQPSFHSVVLEWGLTGSMSHIPSVMIAIQMFGVLIGSIIGGQISDRFGRKLTNLFFFAFLLAFGAASAFSPTWQWFTLARFLIGIGNGAVISVQFVLTTEELVPRWRLLVYVGGWPLGFIMLSLFVTLAPHWKSYSILSNAVGLLPLLLTYFVQESPKFLLERGHMDRAVKVLREIGRINGVDEEGLAKIDAQAPMVHHTSDQNTYSYWHLFRRWKSVKQTLALLFCWLAMSMIGYGISLNLGNFSGNPVTNNLTIAVAGLAFDALVPYLDHKFAWIGRRVLMLWGFGVSGCALLAIAIFTIVGNVPTYLIIITVGSSMSLGTTTWIAGEIYAIELYPTVLRNMANALCNSMARIGGMIAPLIMLLGSVWPPLYFFVLFGMALCSWLLAFTFLPETKGKLLPDLDTLETGA